MIFKKIPSPYFSSRNGKKIDGVVIHTTVGSYQGTINYFQSNTYLVSAHYVVSLAGEITQMVDEDKAAHHAGRVSNAKTPVYKGFNPNWNTVGIENADDKDPHGANRENQYPALSRLVADICKRNGIPIDRNHICGHREIYDKKTCPGNIDVDRVVNMARAVSNQNPGDSDELAACVRDRDSHWDRIIAVNEQLGLPGESPLDTTIRSIRGLQGRETDLTNQLTEKDKKIAELTQEVQNRIEQLARETTALLRDKKAVESAYEESQNQIGVEKRLRKEVEGQMDTMAKELGKTKNDLAACKAGQVKLTIWEYLKNLFTRHV